MIDLIPTADQQEIADAIGAFLRDTLPLERLREDQAKTEADPAIWSQLAELGCFGLSLAEERGGVGLTLAEEVLSFREYGRYLVSPAMLGTVLAAKIAAEEGLSALTGDLVAGRRRAGIGQVTPSGVQLFDVGPEDLVVLWDDDGARLFEAAALGAVRAEHCIDGALTMGVVAPIVAEPLARIGAAGEPVPLIAALLIAASLCGVLEGIRDMAVDYAKTRMQFGMPIGAFQGVKHKCADIGLAVETAWSQTVFAALCRVENTADAPFQALNAMSIAASLALDAAHVNIQIHGGMGFTAEIGAHLYLKRVHVLRALAGDPVTLRHKLLTLPAEA